MSNYIRAMEEHADPECRPEVPPEPNPGEPGRCPKCGNYELEYGTMEYEADAVFWEVSCGCGWYGREWHLLTFIEMADRWPKSEEVPPCH